jgi:gliding motility-associated-like protein
LPPNISNTTGQFDSLQYGAYTLQIQDNIGCIKDTIIQIDQNAQINLSSLTIKNPTCFNSKDGSFFFSAEGGVVPLTFSVNGSPFTADTGYYGLSSGNYFVIMKDSLNCIADTIISLVQPDSLELFIDSTVDVYCYPQKTGMIFSHATGGNNIIYTYILSPVNKINTTGQFTNLGLGTYTIFVKDSLGCLSSKKVTLNESPEKMVPTIVASEINCVDTNSKGTATVTVVGGYPPYTYGWTNNPPDSTETAYNLIYGPYIVYITDSAGCTIADTVDIGASSCCEVYFPNAFTPNNDFLNDDWTPIVKGTVSDYYLQIFDRWGNRVYNSSVPNKAWDGKYKELPMDIDTYFYLIQYKCTFSNENRLQKGSFHLFR